MAVVASHPDEEVHPRPHKRTLPSSARHWVETSTRPGADFSLEHAAASDREPNFVLKYQCEDGWIQKMAEQVSSRADYHGLVGISKQNTMRYYKTLDLPHQALLRRVLNGTFYADGFKANFDSKFTATCNLCKVLGTVEHRCTTCKRFATVHQQHKTTTDKWDTMPGALREHVIANNNTTEEDYNKLLMMIPDETFQLPLLPQNGAVDVFADGALLWPAAAAWRLGAWAAVFVQTATCFAIGHLSGCLQTIVGAEITAAHAAIQSYSRLRLWCDNAYTVKTLNEILRGMSRQWHLVANGDLWARIEELVQARRRSDISIAKVKAHTTISPDASRLEFWKNKWNDAADTAAKTINKNREDEFNEKWQLHADEVVDMRAAAASVQQLHIGIGKAVTNTT
ncbi:unnamed protein product [Polarella glacialis]|uniref:RNase H type-1 domain-containing protein n=1 Tax=Polarella glacialis TaxID=89957 RepID=A0A813DRH0_POLGL|nr:unnamed protein product [Polarella glacialis]CAE8591279.1 unnamed protein product [Polarella glacialis]